MTHRSARRTLIAYDVTDDPRRLRLATEILKYGDRVQYSVFMVDATPTRLARLLRALEELMEPGQDSVLVCDLGPLGVADRAVTWLGRVRPVTVAEDFVV